MKKKTSQETNCHVDKISRTLYICGEITQALASEFRRHFKQLERSNGDIVVEINSPGGDVEAGFLIMDTILLSECTVVTRVAGSASSMGAMILIAGDEREALPRSLTMIHQGSTTVSARMEDLDNEVAVQKRLEDECWSILDARTEKQAGYWKNRCAGKNLYLNADDALLEGIVHKICG